jgi:Nucleotidyl transferase AbiEii toxin, Type IV TA system
LVDRDAREKSTLSLLDRWPWERGGVVIGGYAVIAYGPPRYSDDVDIVIPAASSLEIREWLRTEGLRLHRHSTPNPQNFGGQVERYKSADVTLDLLAGAVRDRDAKVDIPAEWVIQNSRIIRLVTLAGRTENSIPIARPAALWALKLQAGRPRDIADLFAMYDTPFDSEEVRALFQRLSSKSLLSKLQSVRSRLETRQLFVDSLSRRQLGSPSSPDNIRRWNRFVSLVDGIVKSLGSPGNR